MSQFHIRRLSSADARDYRTIRLAALQGDAAAFSSSYSAEAGRSLAEFAQRLETSVVYGAYCDGLIAGMAGFKRYDGARESHKAFLWGMYVRPELRGRGTARALVEAVLAAASAAVEQLTLAVATDNVAAIALYRELGFESYGIEPRALKGDHGYTDDMLMVRFLNARTTAAS